jgi:hypothetical protein
MHYYSKSTNGFYDDEIHTPEQLPADRVEITSEEHQALYQAHSNGRALTSDADGRPTLVDLPPPNEQAGMTKREALRQLASSDVELLRKMERWALDSGCPIVDLSQRREALREVVRGGAASDV